MNRRLAAPYRNHYPDLDEAALRVIRAKAARCAGRGGLVDLDPEDLEQEIVLDILARLPKFDPSRGAFSTFAARVADHTISGLLKPRRTSKRDWKRNGASLHDQVEDGEDGRVDRWRTLSRDADRRRTGASDGDGTEASALRLDVRAAIDSLPPALRDLSAWLLHYTIAEASRAADIPRSTLQHRVKEIRERFQEAGLQTYFGSRGHSASERR